MDIKKEDLEGIISGLGVTKSGIESTLANIKSFVEKNKDKIPDEAKAQLDILDSKVFKEFDQLKKDIEKLTGV